MRMCRAEWRERPAWKKVGRFDLGLEPCKYVAIIGSSELGFKTSGVESIEIPTTNTNSTTTNLTTGTDSMGVLSMTM